MIPTVLQREYVRDNQYLEEWTVVGIDRSWWTLVSVCHDKTEIALATYDSLEEAKEMMQYVEALRLKFPPDRYSHSL